MSQVHCGSLRSPIKFCISPARKELSEFDLIERKHKNKKRRKQALGFPQRHSCMSCNLSSNNSIYKGTAALLTK